MPLWIKGLYVKLFNKLFFFLILEAKSNIYSSISSILYLKFETFIIFLQSRTKTDAKAFHLQFIMQKKNIDSLKVRFSIPSIFSYIIKTPFPILLRVNSRQLFRNTFENFANALIH